MERYHSAHLDTSPSPRHPSPHPSNSSSSSIIPQNSLVTASSSSHGGLTSPHVLCSVIVFSSSTQPAGKRSKQPPPKPTHPVDLVLGMGGWMDLVEMKVTSAIPTAGAPDPSSIMGWVQHGPPHLSRAVVVCVLVNLRQTGRPWGSAAGSAKERRPAADGGGRAVATVRVVASATAMSEKRVSLSRSSGEGWQPARVWAGLDGWMGVYVYTAGTTTVLRYAHGFFVVLLWGLLACPPPRPGSW